jgi:2-dehydropantoate 2-reductase
VNILVYGAGVMGTLYAARLQESGQHVTVLARGDRLANIRRYGLVLENVATGDHSETQVDVIEHLAPSARFDLAIVFVRRDQLASVMPELTANHRIPTILFMLNNPTGWAHLMHVLGQDRVLLGFPGAGGTRDGHVIRYALISQQPTTLGEWGGQRTARLRTLVAAFRKAEFPTKISRNMNAWLQAHAFFVTSVSGAIYLSGGDCRRLSEDTTSLALMTEGVREGFASVRALGMPVTPFALRVLFTWLPQAFVLSYWRRFFGTTMADYVFGRHARLASQEMREIADDCRSLLEQSQVEAPALVRLYRAVDAYASSVRQQTGGAG